MPGWPCATIVLALTAFGVFSSRLVADDRSTVAESAQLASQLPELIRGAFYENWRPAGTPEHYRDAAAFLDRVRDGAGLAGETEASFVVSAVMTVLRQHVSRGELEDVLATMPTPVRNLLETDK